MPNTEFITREFESYRKDEDAAKAILTAADEEKRSTTPEEDAQFDALLASAKKHKDRADKLKAHDEDSVALADAVRSFVGDQSDPESGRGGDSGDKGLLAQIVETSRQWKAGHEDFESVMYGTVDLQKRDEAVRAIADFSDSGALYTTDFSTKVAVYLAVDQPRLDHQCRQRSADQPPQPDRRSHGLHPR
jgi:hypothetical protein